MSSIYALRDPVTLEIRYVGKTTRSLAVRLRHHLKPKALSVCTHKNSWIRKLLREGHRPLIELLETVDNQQENQAEIAWIARLRASGSDLTNGTNGGDGGRTRSGFKLTREQDRALREGLVRARQEGRIPPHAHSQESKELMSRNALGRPKSEEHKAALSKAHLGKQLTTEHKEALSAALKGRVMTPEHKQRISEAKRGRFTPAMREALERARLTNTGREFTEEHKEKLRGRFKLDADARTEIRRSLAEGTRSIAALAREYNVDPGTITRIRDTHH